MQVSQNIERPCGTCRACCKVFTIEEIGKKDASWCEHSTPQKGCSIYETRPKTCRDYACLWKRGFGEDGDRPDLLGIMLDMSEYRGKPCVEMYEMEPGSLDTERGAGLTLSFLNQGYVVSTHIPAGPDSFFVRYIRKKRSEAVL